MGQWSRHRRSGTSGVHLWLPLWNERSTVCSLNPVSQALTGLLSPAPPHNSCCPLPAMMVGHVPVNSPRPAFGRREGESQRVSLSVSWAVRCGCPPRLLVPRLVQCTLARGPLSQHPGRDPGYLGTKFTIPGAADPKKGRSTFPPHVGSNIF